jgi:hypothetical protein
MYFFLFFLVLLFIIIIIVIITDNSYGLCADDLFCPLGTPTGGFPPLSLPTVNTSEATDSNLGKVREFAGLQQGKHDKAGQAVLTVASVVCGTIAVLWVAVGYCAEQWLPAGLARALPLFDIFSHSHYSDALPRLMICQRTVLGGCTTVLALIFTAFLTSYVIVSSGSDGAWETAGQYGVIGQKCE